MKVLHLLTSGGVGGIETLCKDYSFYSKLDNFFLIAWSGGAVTEEMIARGDQCIFLGASKKEVIRTYKYIEDLCIREKIEAVVVHHAAPVFHLYLLLLVKKIPNLNTYVYAHSDAADMYRKGEKGALLRKIIMRYVLKRVHKVIAISKFVKESVQYEFGISANKIAVIYNGVDTSKFVCEHLSDSNETNIIFVGRLVKEKGVQILLEAISRIPKDKNIKCTIVGTGTYEGALKDKAEHLGVNDRVVFLGRRRDIPELFSKSDIFVHAAIWKEGFGITIVEAMAAGLICVCSDSGAIPEIIDNRMNGFLFETGNVEQLANRLIEICDMNQQQKAEISMRAKEDAKKFDISTFVNQLDSLLNTK